MTKVRSHFHWNSNESISMSQVTTTKVLHVRAWISFEAHSNSHIQMLDLYMIICVSNKSDYMHIGMTIAKHEMHELTQKCHIKHAIIVFFFIFQNETDIKRTKIVCFKRFVPVACMRQMFNLACKLLSTAIDLCKKKKKSAKHLRIGYYLFFNHFHTQHSQAGHFCHHVLYPCCFWNLDHRLHFPFHRFYTVCFASPRM